jgi:dCTP deaminase
VILTGSEIIKQVESGRIVIDPFNEDQVGPNSYDLRLGDELKIMDCEGNLLSESHDDPDTGGEFFMLYPGEFYLGHTLEIAGSNHYVPLLDGRSSWARKGLQIHMTAGFGDLGFIGQWTLEMHSVRQWIKAYIGQRICQISFWQPIGEIDRLYSGKYVDSRGVIASRLEDE